MTPSKPSSERSRLPRRSSLIGRAWQRVKDFASLIAVFVVIVYSVWAAAALVEYARQVRASVQEYQDEVNRLRLEVYELRLERKYEANEENK